MELDMKEKYLLEAFSDEKFISDINAVRLEIEGELNKFISFLKEKLLPEQKIFENVESRIKSKQSFQEKIHRKDYIKVWNVTEDKLTNQNLIATNLPDLLGFRINCFFWQDESIIYSHIEKYYNEHKFSNFYLNFSENKRQKNGHIIYKLSGAFKKQYCFEIQIKSIMHNMWGEVEHKTIYKNREYDANLRDKKEITEQVFNILQASDKQLIALFKRHNDKKQLIYALFYEETKKEISKLSGTDILADHYDAYFQLLNNYDIIQKYVAYKLLGQEFHKETLPIINYNEKVKILKELITSEFLEYNLQCLYYIFSQLYEVVGYEDFMLRFSQMLLSRYCNEETQDPEDDAFAEEEETDKDYSEDILNLLQDKMGGRKKDD